MVATKFHRQNHQLARGLPSVEMWKFNRQVTETMFISAALEPQAHLIVLIRSSWSRS
jgi:hypothetical protein